MHVLFNWKKNILKETKQNIFFQFFFTNDLQRNGDKMIQKIGSCDNFADLLTKSLPCKTFEQLVNKFRHRHLNDVSLHDEEKWWTLFPFKWEQLVHMFE